ncbi:DUF6397 family protein [Streptomyces tibetensis]|uniref:DUF6397 family protein n=1 Tax=Streptomyces tibetensis TaxID=2382123 RepID=UPI003407754B
MARTSTTSDRTTWAPSRAARELELKRREFDLAVNLGLIRTRQQPPPQPPPRRRSGPLPRLRAALLPAVC